MLGEETVLLKALEGKRGQPEQRPPHPAERGLFGMPTVVHNVQTLAAVPWIVANGADGVRGDRHARQPRHDPRPGPRRRRARRRGGPARARRCATSSGSAGGAGRPARSRRSSSAARPAASCPPTLLDTPYEFEALREAGAHVGSGSVVVADERACIVDLARLLTRFCADEACGKTIPCRIGLRRVGEIGDRVVDGPPAGRPTSSC